MSNPHFRDDGMYTDDFGSVDQCMYCNGDCPKEDDEQYMCDEYIDAMSGEENEPDEE